MIEPHEVEAAMLVARRQLASGDGLLAQSVCLDVLAASPDHVEAIVVLVEAIAESQTLSVFLQTIKTGARRSKSAVLGPGKRQ